MKRISKTIFFILLGTAVPFMLASGQDNKVERKVKIVTVDKDGTETIIDTTFTGESAPGSITLKDGKVVFFETPGVVTADILKKEGKGKIYVTTTINEDGDEEKGKEEKVIIISGDKGEWTVSPSGEASQHIYAYISDENGDKTDKHIILKSDNSKDVIWEEKDGKTFNINVSTDTESGTEMTKYVLAKEGVVVTVECDNVEKAKDIIKTIEEKLDAGKKK